jgi:hypothetical protein
LDNQSPPKRSSPLVALQNLLDFLRCLFSTSTPSNLYDFKDEGIDNENENMDKDYFDYNGLLGTTMEAPRKKEIAKKVQVQDASGLKASQGQESSGIPTCGKGSKGLEKEGVEVCKGVRRFEKTYESGEKKGKVLPKNYSMVESFDKIGKIS